MSGALDDVLFRALADPRRRRLLETLAAQPREIADLARRCDLARSLAAHHLAVLQTAGLVSVIGRRAVVRPEPLTSLRRYFDEALTAAAIASPNA